MVLRDLHGLYFYFVRLKHLLFLKIFLEINLNSKTFAT